MCGAAAPASAEGGLPAAAGGIRSDDEAVAEQVADVLAPLHQLRWVSISTHGATAGGGAAPKHKGCLSAEGLRRAMATRLPFCRVE